jgi:UDP-N-acetyl-D-glucosamine dehydrogenase
MISPTTTPLAQQLKSRLLAHEAKIGIIGLGYVGLPLALLYSGASFPVTGFDIDDSKVDALKEGKSYIYRIPAEEIQEARANGMVATSDFSNLADMDAIAAQ